LWFNIARGCLKGDTCEYIHEKSESKGSKGDKGQQVEESPNYWHQPLKDVLIATTSIKTEVLLTLIINYIPPVGIFATIGKSATRSVSFILYHYTQPVT
jgi:hypothetical protein